MFHLFRRAIWLRVCGILFAALACASASFAEDPPTTNNFLKLTQEQRYWWLHGAVTTTAHLVSMHDKQKGDCVAKWFLEQKEPKQKLFEESLARYPAELPTTLLLVLLTRNCGQLQSPLKN